MAKIGKLIQNRRRSMRMSRAEMSRLSTFSPQYILEIEQGKRAPGKPSTLDIIAATLGLPRDVVYFSVGRLPPDLADLDIDDTTICKAFDSVRSIFGRK